MESQGIAPDRIHLTNLIKGFCKNCDIINAEKVFAGMMKINVHPDPVTFNILAKGFCKNGFVDKASDLVLYMINHGIQPTKRTYHLIIDRLCRENKLEEAEKLFMSLEEKGIGQKSLLPSAMVSAQIELNNTKEACALFIWLSKQGHLVNEIACSKLVSELCNKGDLRTASIVVKTMLDRHITPDKITYCKLIGAYSRVGDMTNAKIWFEDMRKRGVSPDVVVYTTLMNGYCKVNFSREACQLFREMIERGIPVDVHAFTVILDGHLKANHHLGWLYRDKKECISEMKSKFLILLDSMNEMEIKPDIVCYTILIDGYFKMECVQAANRLLSEMIGRGILPDACTYTALLCGYCHLGQIGKAEVLLEEMILKGVKPDLVVLSVMARITFQQVTIISEAMDVAALKEQISLGPLMLDSRFVLVGDHYQLPPLVQSVEARENGMSISLFCRLSEAHPQAISALQRQYRMCAGIMELSNALIYGNRLRCGSSEVADAKLKLSCSKPVTLWLHEILNANKPVIFASTDMLPANEERENSTVVNYTEAYIVAEITKELIKRGIAGDDIGIISPYNSQVNIIRQILDASIEVQTIDKYQGRDKDCILLSFVRSLKNSGSCISSLLGEWHRINVAITRAKKKLIMVGSHKTLSKIPLLKLLIEKVSEQDGIVHLSNNDIPCLEKLKKSCNPKVYSR